MARLTTLLKADSVEVRERTFESAIGIEDLNEAFVSLISHHCTFGVSYR